MFCVGWPNHSIHKSNAFQKPYVCFSREAHGAFQWKVKVQLETKAFWLKNEGSKPNFNNSISFTKSWLTFTYLKLRILIHSTVLLN